MGVVASVAGETYHSPMAAIRATAATEDDPELLVVLRLVRAAGLPTSYDTDGVNFTWTTAIHLDHGGPEIGRGSVVDRVGARFELTGWVQPTRADDVRTRGRISPRMMTLAARIEGDVLRVSQALIADLSVVSDAALSDTTVTVGPPRACLTRNGRLLWDILMSSPSPRYVTTWPPNANGSPPRRCRPFLAALLAVRRGG